MSNAGVCFQAYAANVVQDTVGRIGQVYFHPVQTAPASRVAEAARRAQTRGRLPGGTAAFPDAEGRIAFMDSAVADLMRRNLLSVFNEPDPARRAAAIALTYAEDVVWHEPDRVVHGRQALAQRAAELHAQTPDFVFRPRGPVSVNDDLGHLAFEYGPEAQPDAVTGMDIGRCRDGVIVELYTFVDGVGQPAR